MNKKSYLFTSESVSEGHPDKVCDRISDMVVDTYLAKEPLSRVACETLTTTNKVVLAGETRGPEIKKDDLIQKVRGCIKDIGYEQKGFHWKNCDIDVHLHSQSADIAMGVDSKDNKDEGAGDQGIMFGYACNETEVLMPAPIYYSHKILELMAADRKSGKLKSIEPDSKSQVTFEYVDGKPVKVKSVVISSQHSADVNQSQVKELLPILESVSQQNKSLLIVAEDIDGEALAAMIVNKMRSILKCCAVKAPDFGERRTHILEDIATLTGGTVISKQKGMRLDKITFDDLVIGMVEHDLRHVKE